MSDMSDKKSLAWRAPLDTYREVEALAEENDIKKSDVLRRATEEYLDDEDDTARGRSVSPITIVGVVAIALAPTLLATGYTAAGVAAVGVAGLYLLLWLTAYDVVLEETLDDARRRVVDFFRYVMFEDRLDDEPDGVVERATRADAVAIGVFSVGLLLAAPLVGLYYVGYIEAFVAAIGPYGAFGYGVVLLLLFYIGVTGLAIHAIASLAVATARSGEATPADDVDGDPSRFGR